MPLWTIAVNSLTQLLPMLEQLQKGLKLHNLSDVMKENVSAADPCLCCLGITTAKHAFETFLQLVILSLLDLCKLHHCKLQALLDWKGYRKIESRTKKSLTTSKILFKSLNMMVKKVLVAHLSYMGFVTNISRNSFQSYVNSKCCCSARSQIEN